jgi:DNA helicase-2/ATP-dependent DNA helicase PcrA
LEELKRFYEDKDWMVDRLEQFGEDLKIIATMRPFAAVNFIRRGVGYDDFIQEYSEYRGMRSDDMYEILDELQEEAKSHKNFEAWFAYIQEYREELKKQADKSRQLRAGKEQEEDAVMLMTMHGAKGLEFQCVFIPDANEGVTPHNKAVLTADLEEERRLFYVAMTRAKSCLHIYYLKERFNKEMSVSRFVEEILADDDTDAVTATGVADGTDTVAGTGNVRVTGTGAAADTGRSRNSRISRKSTR